MYSLLNEELRFKPIRPLIIALTLLALFLGMTGVCHAEVIDDERALKVFKDSPVAGASFGKGRVYRQGKLTGHVNLAKLSLGFQLGGQAFSELIFFKDKRAYEEFISGTFEFDATASAIAITAGVQAQAGTTGSTVGASTGPATGKQLGANYNKGMAVFIHAKGGLMYEASVGGQIFSFEPLGKSRN